MPYLRVTIDSQEIERRDLAGSVVIGRSMGCDLAVRDIMLSRRHCQISEAGANQWQAMDLASKNGTMHNGRPLCGATLLRPADVLTLGRLTVQFEAGDLAGAGLTPLRCPPPRPADPSESLSGTCVGFTLLEPAQAPAGGKMALPRPEPKRPAAYEREDIYSLLTTIASSSWDSIYEQARRPGPGSGMGGEEHPALRRRARPRSPIDLSLQVCQGGEGGIVESLPVARRSLQRRHLRRRLQSGLLSAMILMCLIGLRIGSGGRGVWTAAAAPANATVSETAPPPHAFETTAALGQIFAAMLPLVL